MIEKNDNVVMYLTRLGKKKKKKKKKHPFISILNICPRFKYLPKGCLYFFMLSIFI